MKTKKILSMVLTGVTVIGLLAGCGSDSNTSGAGSTSDASTNQTAQMGIQMPEQEPMVFTNFIR